MDQSPLPTVEKQPPVPPTRDTGSILAVGLEIHRLTACLLEPVNDQFRLAAWWIAPSQPHRSVAEQVRDLCDRFGSRIQRRLWDRARDAPFILSTEPVRYPPLDHVVISASPRPRVRVWAAGLTAHNSLAAARGALAASQAQIMGVTSLRADADPQALAHDLSAALPEVLVLAGGYNFPESRAHRPLIMLSRYVASALRELPDEAVPEIIFAGNFHAYRAVASVLRADARCSIRQADNVLPVPGQAQEQSLAQAVDDFYWRKCQRMRGFAELERWHTPSIPIMTIEASFERLVQLWLELHGLPELYGIYAGHDRWLHVWADARTNRVLIRFTAAGTQPSGRAWRPSLRLVSGLWIEGSDPPDSVEWWDRSGLAPAIAAAAHTVPRAALEALEADLLVRGDG